MLGVDMDPVTVDLARRDTVDEQLATVEFRCRGATGLDAVRGQPGAVIVVEDVDHPTVFAHSHCIALDEHVAIYNEAARLRGGDQDRPRTPGDASLRGLVDVRLDVVQPALPGGDAKRIHEITLADDPDTIVSFPRFFEVFGRRPGADQA